MDRRGLYEGAIELLLGASGELSHVIIWRKTRVEIQALPWAEKVPVTRFSCLATNQTRLT